MMVDTPDNNERKEGDTKDSSAEYKSGTSMKSVLEEEVTDAATVIDHENDNAAAVIPAEDSSSRIAKDTTESDHKLTPITNKKEGEEKKEEVDPSLASPLMTGTDGAAAIAVTTPVSVSPTNKNNNSTIVRHILHKFVSKVSADILSAAGSSHGSYSVWNLFGLNSGTPSAKDIRRRQCAVSLEQLGKALLHIESSPSKSKSKLSTDEENSVSLVDEEDLSEQRRRQNEEWDNRNCSKLVGLFVDVLCTWTGLSLVSGEDGALIYEGNTRGSGEDMEMFQLDMIQEMGVQPHQLARCINCAQELVAHGCMDNIVISIKLAQMQSSSANAMHRYLPKSMMKSEGNTGKNGDSLLQRTATRHAVQDRNGENIDISDSDSNSSLKYDVVNVLAVDRIADAVFSTDLSSEDVELSALKFLLTAASRTVNISKDNGADELYGSSNAMLRGNRLLWTVKILYHVFLQTTSIPNRTTARAALEQIVNSVFSRMESCNQTSEKAKSDLSNDSFSESTKIEGAAKGEDKTLDDDKDTYVYLSVWESLGFRADKRVDSSKPQFPSLNHRDAFIVFRSLCKLAMKSHKRTSKEDMNEAKDDDRMYGSIYVDDDLGTENTKSPPTLRSKILSLELLLSILDDPGSELTCCDFFKYAVRQYLCVALLKNFTSNVTRVVGLSLRLFVPIIRHYRSDLKTELEAFVTNVFFVILDSPNSNIEHKGLVVTLFKEICSDPSTLAEIFLNYDCDMSAVDLFHRIVSSLARTAKGTLTQEEQDTANSHLVVAATGIEKLATIRQRQRSLRLSAMKALRQILASLYSCMIVVIDPKTTNHVGKYDDQNDGDDDVVISPLTLDKTSVLPRNNESKRNLVEIYDSKRKRKESLDDIVLRFNQRPSAGIKYAGQINFIQADDPISVASFLLEHRDRLEKTQIGELLGREADYQNGFYIRVLQAYVLTFSFNDMSLDEAIRLFLSGFRLPGEAQKIDRIMEKFAERYCTQNPHVFPTADAAFILSFSIIMLNTDLHNPAIKPERRMTKEGFIRNNRGICNGSDLPSELLIEIFERIQANQISLKEDDEAREKQQSDSITTTNNSITSITTPGVLFGSHLDEINKRKASKFLQETDQMLRETEDVLTGKRRTLRSKHLKKGHGSFVRTKDSGLQDEYVSPMFEVTWGAALAVFSTALEKTNGTTHSAQWAEATENERFSMNRNAVSTTEVCLSGFRFAICVAGLCGHETARNAYINALASFSQLGISGRLLEHRHIRCIQTLLKIARDDGECLGNSWGRVFLAMSEVARLQRLLDKLARVKIHNRREDILWNNQNNGDDDDDDLSYQSDSNFDTMIDDVELDDDLDRRTIDELNAKAIQDAISSELIDTIYLRSSLLTDSSIKDFVQQLCRVSRSEITGSNSPQKQDNLVTSTSSHQPVIYSLQRLVEVAHYNMDSRLLCVWGDIWSTVSSHLVDIALHPTNEAVSIYAVDSLRQLSIQYLQRQELGIFEFQRRFLKPYEVIMSRCVFPAPRELLLKGVEQILLVCGGGGTDSIAITGANGSEGVAVNNTLRSGWRPILIVLGLAAHDREDSIANMGFKMLHNLLDELKKDVAKSCLSLGIIGKVNSKGSEICADYSHCHGYLMAEHFVDLVESLTKFISCPRDSLAKKALAYLVMMSDWLGNERNPKPVSGNALNKLRSRNQEINPMEGNLTEDKTAIEPAKSNELELWWPLLLGFSQSVGDERNVIRSNALAILMKIINRDFLRVPAKNEEVSRGSESDLITLQLIFRGILHPILEFANVTDFPVQTSLYLPRDFTYLISPQPSPSRKSQNIVKEEELDNWIENTFEKYMDSCIALCNRASDYFHDNCIVDEIISIVNACLQSDSWILHVRGLKYLEQFLSIEDPPLGELSLVVKENISMLLYRNLSLPLNYASDENVVSLSVQRYSGSYLVRVASLLLLEGSQHEPNPNMMNLEDRLYLAEGLSKYIHNWEAVAKLPEFSDEDQNLTMFTPPHPLENAMYGRKLMMKIILSLTSEEGGFHSSENALLAQELVVNQTHAVFSAFLEKETAITDEPRDPVTEACHIVELGHMTSLVCDLLDGYAKVSDASFFSLTWLKPLLSSLIESNTKPVRVSVQNLISRLFKGPSESIQPVSPFRVLDGE